MKWAASMHESVTGTPSDEVTKDEGSSLSSEPADWNSQEVWLKRVKQPRDRAALAASLASGN
jgi:hypothetical protein